MKYALFEELKKSIKQGGKILRGKKLASREFNLDNSVPNHIDKIIGMRKTFIKDK